MVSFGAATLPRFGNAAMTAVPYRGPATTESVFSMKARGPDSSYRGTKRKTCLGPLTPNATPDWLGVLAHQKWFFSEFSQDDETGAATMLFQAHWWSVLSCSGAAARRYDGWTRRCKMSTSRYHDND